MAPSRRLSATEKAKAPKEGPDSPPPKRGRVLPRKYATTPAVAPRGRGRSHSKEGAASGGLVGTSSYGGGRCGHGSRCEQARRAVATRPPRPRSHSGDSPSKFVVWAEKPAGAWLQLPCFFAGALPAGAPGGFWVQADGCCSKASWVEAKVTDAGNVFLNAGGSHLLGHGTCVGGAPSTSGMTASDPLHEDLRGGWPMHSVLPGERQRQ